MRSFVRKTQGSSAGPEHVVRNVRALILVCAATAVLVVAAVLWQTQSLLHNLEQGTSFHLDSIKHATEIYQTAAELRGSIFDEVAPPQGMEQETIAKEMPALSTFPALIAHIRAEISALRKLQGHGGEADLAGATQRLVDRFAPLEANAAKQEPLSNLAPDDLRRLGADMGPLMVAAEQLTRLHEIEYRKDQIEIADAERVGQYLLVLLVAGASLIGGIVVWRLQRQIRGILEADARVNRELIRTMTGLANAQRIAGLGYWELSEGTEYLRWSDEMFDILGLSRDSVTPTKEQFYSLVHPEDRERVQAWERGLFDNEAPGHIEYRIVRPDGTERVVEEIASHFAATPDDPIRISGITRDVTEHRQFEQSLRESQARFEHAERMANLYHWVTDEPAQNWVYASKNVQSVLQFLSIDTRPTTVADYYKLLHPDDRARIEAHDERFRQAPGRYERTYRIIGAAGAIRYFKEAGEPIYDTASRLIGYRGTTQDITELKTAEAELKESQRQFEHAERMANLCHWITDDKDANWIYASKNTARMFGLESPEALLGETSDFTALIHPDDHEDYIELSKEIVGAPRAYENSYRIVRPDGAVRHLKEVGEPMRDETGRLVGFRGTTQDVTDQKVAEAKAKERETALSQAQRIARLGYWRYSPVERRLMDWSGLYADIFGIPREDGWRIGTGDFEFIHPDDRARIGATYCSAEKTLTGYDHEFRIRRPDGEIRYIHEVGEFEDSDDGTPTVLFGTVQDVTEQKKIEAALRESQARFEQAERIANLWHWSTDSNDDWISASKNAPRMFGVESEEELTRSDESYYRFIHPDDRDELIKRNEDFLRSPRRYENNFRIVRPDGEIRYLHEMGEPVYDDAGRFVGFRGTTQDVTEQKTIEADLRLSKDQFEQAERIGGLMHWKTDDDESWLFVSKNATAIFGVQSPADAFSSIEKFSEFIHPDDREEFRIRDANFVQGQLRYENDYRIVRPDGTIRHLHEVGEPFYDEAGGFAGFQGITQDVTEQKTIEAELRRTQAQFEQAERIANLWHWVTDTQDNWLFASKNAAAMYGVESLEDLPKAVGLYYDFVHPDDRDALRRRNEEILRTPQRYENHIRIVRPDGAVRYFHEVGEPVYDEAGQYTGYRGTTQDVTDLKLAQDARRESEERFRATFEQAAVGIAHVDTEGRFLRVNRRLCDIVGYDRDELVQLKFQDITHRDDLEADQSSTNRVLAGEISSFSMEKRYVRKNRSIVWIDLTVALVRDDTGEPNYFIAVVEDITERKMAEEEVRRLNATLERRVEERTQELRAAQEELLRSERLATLGRLTATVSHELRNPLAAARTSALVLKQRVDGADEKVHAALGRIERGITRCDRIVDELLDFTRISALESESTPLDSWLEEVIAEQNVPETVTLRHDLGLGEAAVLIDPDRLRRAVINVMDNACQAMTEARPAAADDGGRADRLTVRTRRRNGRIEIEFEDSGPGIPDDLRERIFEPLFSTKSFGAGLGLPVVQQIMEQHGGGIDIETVPAGGTRVCLWLSAETPAAAEPPGRTPGAGNSPMDSLARRD